MVLMMRELRGGCLLEQYRVMHDTSVWFYGLSIDRDKVKARLLHVYHERVMYQAENI